MIIKASKWHEKHSHSLKLVGWNHGLVKLGFA